MLARWIGVSFLALAAYTATRGVFEIARGSHVEPSVLGLLLTVFATFGMPIIGYFKWKTSRRLGSKGLAAEAKESIACSIDSALTMVAMIAGLLAAPSWVDPALSLLMVPWVPARGLARSRAVHAHVH
jgi:divalent metal cation (Fe/Co/Zn/Cd) transporter